MKKQIIFFCTITFLIISSLSFGDEKNPELTVEDVEKARFYWTGMLEARYKLRSGILKMKIEEMFTDKENQEQKSEIKYEIIFDKNVDSFSFLKQRKDIFYHCIRNINEKLLYNKRFVIRRSLNDSFDLPDMILFDFYSAGLLYGNAFNNEYSLTDARRKFIDHPQNKLISLSHVSQDVYLLVFRSFLGDTDYQDEIQYWIDISKDYSIIRTQRFFVGQANNVRQVDKNNFFRGIDFTVSWEKFTTPLSDVWLPVESSEVMNKSSIFKRNIKYSWQSVNETIDPFFFTVESMKVKDQRAHESP